MGPPLDRRQVLDRAHRGAVIGALGSLGPTDRRSGPGRLAALLAVLGPGLVVLVADNDAGGIGTYAQVGADHGVAAAALLVPLGLCLYVNQEMAARLGAVTGAGHARLIHDRFGRWWGRLALADLVVLNLLLLVTELVGVGMGVGELGVSRRVAVPAAAVALAVLGGQGSFRRWERIVLAAVVVSFAAVPLAAVVAHGHPHPARAGVDGPGGLLVLLAVTGTTIAPWQLFLHQSNVVDKRITPRLLRLTRADTAAGVTAFLIGAMAMVAIGHLSGASHPTSAAQVAAGLGSGSGRWAAVAFALLLVNGSLLGGAAISLSTAYAVGDLLGTRHSLHRPWRDARTFHATRSALLLAAAAAVVCPGSPLAAATTGVQILAAVLLPSALVFILLLANDRAVLGPWTNGRGRNAVAGGGIGGLLASSALLAAQGFGLHLTAHLPVLGPALAAGVVAGAVTGARLTPQGSYDEDPTGAPWTMPRLEALAPAPSSPGRTLGLSSLRVYVVLTAAAGACALVRELSGR